MWTVLNGSVGTREDVDWSVEAREDADYIERERRDMWECGLYYTGWRQDPAAGL